MFILSQLYVFQILTENLNKHGSETVLMKFKKVHKVERKSKDAKERENTENEVQTLMQGGTP